tara:strand:+ start:32 stop:409 length:378 start_codon:yes stop_codon:yes gene_type:complete
MIEGGDIKHSGLHHYSYDESGNVSLNQTGFEVINTTSTTVVDGIPENERHGFFCAFKLIGGAHGTAPKATVTFETFHGDGSTGSASEITITDIATGEMIHGPFKRLALDAQTTTGGNVQLLCIKG